MKLSMFWSSLAVLLPVVTAYFDVPSLTPDNYNSLTEGKTVFIKFFVPWCSHSKAIAPDWLKLAEEWSGHEQVFVAEVDCTETAAEALCKENHIRGFPAIKWGDPQHLHDYVGTRDFKDLNQFVRERARGLCSAASIDNCQPEERQILESFLKLSEDEIDMRIEAEEAKINQAEEEFNGRLKELQDQYHVIADQKDDKIDAIMASGLALVKTVKAHRLRMDRFKEEL